jgi:serine phosphatase RsbU (regulator of sigma subunit)
MLGMVTMIDVWASPDIILRPLLLLGPAFASLWCGIRRTAVVGLTALALCVALSYHHHTLGRKQNTLSLLTMAGVAAASVIASADRQKRERLLADVRSIAEVAQRVLLRPVPRLVGSMHIAVSYTSATAEARIGGDLYEVTLTPFGVRVIVGDVQGKGLEAVETAADVLGAFREAAYDAADLTGVAARIETALRRRPAPEPSGPRSDEGSDEKFVTAVLAEFGESDIVTLLDYGHPPPLVLRGDGGGAFAEPDDVAPPFGLSDLVDAVPRPYTVKFAPDDQMLLYTDGVVEARDGAGRFYPLAERAHLLTADEPEQALEELRADVLRHVGGRIADDAAMLLIRRR